VVISWTCEAAESGQQLRSLRSRKHPPDLRRRYQLDKIGVELVALGEGCASIDALTAAIKRAWISDGASAMTTPIRRPALR
jgi:hypothetical protein